MTSTINATMLRAGLSAAVVVAVAGLLAAPAAQAQQKQQQTRAAGAQERELLLCRRQDRHESQGQPDRRAHVRRVHDPAAAALALSDRDGARRQPDRHQFHRHARRPRRLGAVFRAPRLCGLHRRPGRRAAARRTGTEYYGAVQPSRLSQVEERFVAPERFPVWPQAKLHTQWPGTGKPGDVALRPVLCRAGGLDRELRQAAGDQSAGADRADGEDRPVDPA